MRRIASACLVVAALGTIPASAADLRIPPRPRAPPGNINWTGLYIGGHGGYGQAEFSTALASATSGTLSGQGAFAGIQAGYNVQLASWVLGIEGEASLSDITSSVSLGGGGTAEVRFDQRLTLAARFGYAFSRALFYGKFGGAWTSGETWNVTALGNTANVSTSRQGWVAGAGIEYAILGNWSAKLEYSYSNMNDRPLSFATLGTVFATPAATDLTFHAIKLGLNYRFGSLPF